MCSNQSECRCAAPSAAAATGGYRNDVAAQRHGAIDVAIGEDAAGGESALSRHHRLSRPRPRPHSRPAPGRAPTHGAAPRSIAYGHPCRVWSWLHALRSEARLTALGHLLASFCARSNSRRVCSLSRSAASFSRLSAACSSSFAFESGERRRLSERPGRRCVRSGVKESF